MKIEDLVLARIIEGRYFLKMVRITEELVRKRCEHNEGEIGTLEELSLHQENIEKIEHLQNWCRNLKILLFHSNLIPKIENINKLKKLEYLNLSLNIIEKIENLEGCESLEKLDLTLNFVGDLTSIDSLKQNMHLKTLYLTGNPCTDYQGYRQYVIATLPQLKTLDGIDVERSERIQALQSYQSVKERILVEQKEYTRKRLLQKTRNDLIYSQKRSEISIEDYEDEEKIKRFWNEPSDNSPETRIFIAEQTRKQENKYEVKTDQNKRVYRYFNKEGSPLNVNEAQVPFVLTENEDSTAFIFTVKVYKYLDITLLEADVQPTYVKISIKGKALQLVLPEEIKVDQSVAQRSQTTGHLVITMPKVKSIRTLKSKNMMEKNQDKSIELIPYSSKRESLEIGRSNSFPDYSNIIEHNSEMKPPMPKFNIVPEKLPSSNFVDDSSVPPLE